MVCTCTLAHCFFVCLTDDLGQKLLPFTDDDSAAISSAYLPSSLSSISPSPSSSSQEASSSSLLQTPLTYTDSTPTHININDSTNVINSTEGYVSEVVPYPDCNWPATPENIARGKFCVHYEADYPDVCRCDNPVQVRFEVEQVGSV